MKKMKTAFSNRRPHFSGFSNVGETFRNAFRDNGDNLAPNRRNIIRGTIFNNMLVQMTGGVFFTGLILILLQNEEETVRNTYLGNMATLQLLCGMFQLAAPFFVEKMRRRRGFVLTFRLLYHVVNIVVLAVIPLLPLPSLTKADLFMWMVVLMTASNALATPPLSAWHLHSLTESRRGDFFAIQSMILPCINTVTAFLCSLLMDGMKMQGRELTAILILRGIAVLVVMLETYSYYKVSEPDYMKSAQVPKLREVLTVPFRHPKFLLMVLIAVLWGFMANIPSQYYAAYQLEDAKLTYTYMNSANFLNIPVTLLMIPFWNKRIHRYGWLPVLSVSVFLYAFAYFFNGLLTADTQYIYIVSAVYCNMVAPGVTLGMANLPYLRIPERGQSSCIAFYNSVVALASTMGAWAGKYFVLATEGIYLDLFGLHLKNAAYVSFLPFIGTVLLTFIILLIYRYDKKHQEPPREEERENKKVEAAV